MLGWNAYFDLALASAALLGVLGEVASPPINFLPVLWSGFHIPFVVYFYKFYLKTLDVCLRWLLSRVQYGHSLRGSAPILRVPFLFDVSDVFGGGSKVVREFSRCSRVIWLDSHPTYSVVSALVSGSNILRYFRSALVVGYLTF